MKKPFHWEGGWISWGDEREGGVKSRWILMVAALAALFFILSQLVVLSIFYPKQKACQVSIVDKNDRLFPILKK